jgi:excisionase family DNA binding protein
MIGLTLLTLFTQLAQETQMKTLTVKQAGELLEASNDTITRLIQRGEIEAERLTPRGRYRIFEESLLAYAKRANIRLRKPSHKQ